MAFRKYHTHKPCLGIYLSGLVLRFESVTLISWWEKKTNKWSILCLFHDFYRNYYIVQYITAIYVIHVPKFGILWKHPLSIATFAFLQSKGTQPPGEVRQIWLAPQLAKSVLCRFDWSESTMIFQIRFGIADGGICGFGSFRYMR